jgi:type I site-specific restriction-modification system R (restriction) subunit
MTKDQLEHDTLAWLADLGWQHRCGPDIAPDGAATERSDYRQVLLVGRLRQAISRDRWLTGFDAPCVHTLSIDKPMKGHNLISRCAARIDDAKAVREEVAFLQAVKVILTQREISQQKETDEARELAIRQIISAAVVSDEVVDIFDAMGLDKPNIGILDDTFLAKVRNRPERNLAVALLERRLEGEISSRKLIGSLHGAKLSRSDMLTF